MIQQGAFETVVLFSRPKRLLHIVAHQAPLSMEFPRQEDWSGFLFPSSGDHPNPGIDPRFLRCRQILYLEGTISSTCGHSFLAIAVGLDEEMGRDHRGQWGRNARLPWAMRLGHAAARACDSVECTCYITLNSCKSHRVGTLGSAPMWTRNGE